jgi:hypothetical protein
MFFTAKPRLNVQILNYFKKPCGVRDKIKESQLSLSYMDVVKGD